VDQLHTTTAATLYLAVYWVTHAAAAAFVMAGLGAAAFYAGQFGSRVVRRLLARRRAVSR